MSALEQEKALGAAGGNSSEEEAAVLSPEEAGKDDYPHGVRLFLIVFALLLSMFLIALDMTIVATAIPSITDEFHSVVDIGWYASGFFITLAVFQAPWGKAYKHFPLKPAFLASVCLFELGSLICALSNSSIMLIIGRAIAGLGGAGVMGGIYTIMAYIIPPAKVPRYLGLIGAVFSIASVAGPLLGGVFTSKISWRWCFYINLPVGGLALALLVIFLNIPDVIQPIWLKPWDLVLVMDIPGIVLSLGSLVSFTLAMQWGGTSKPWSSPDVIGTLVGAGVLAIVFGIVQWYSGENAMLVTRILKQRTIAALSVFIFLFNASNFALIYNIPEYFQVINGASATESGIRNLPLLLSSALFTLGSGYALGYVGLYQLFLAGSSAIMTLGAGLIYTLDMGSSIGKIIGYQIVVGIGIGLGIQVPVTAAQAFSAPQDVPIVTAVVLFFQLATGAIFVSASQTLLDNRLAANLAQIAPNLDPVQVFSVGATDIRSVYHGDDLAHVLQAYMGGIKDSWALSIALAGATLLCALATERKSLKGVQIAAAA